MVNHSQFWFVDSVKPDTIHPKVSKNSKVQAALSPFIPNARKLSPKLCGFNMDLGRYRKSYFSLNRWSEKLILIERLSVIAHTGYYLILGAKVFFVYLKYNIRNPIARIDT